MAKRKNRKAAVKKTQRTGASLTANRKYKDTVFRMLFSDRKNLLSLYNAINGTAYENPDDLEIVTLENAIYMGMKNDLAFIIDTNGTVKKEDCWTNYLSEAYENLTGEPNLELKVITLNINEGHNKELMEQCQILREYAQYVAKVREFAGNTELNAAVELAVNECIQNNILAEFLRKHKSEVIAMSIFEYDKEEEEKKLREAEYEAGYDEGKKEIIRRMLEAGESVEKITQYTGYKTSELQKLLKEF